MDLTHGDFGGLEEPVLTLSMFHNMSEAHSMYSARHGCTYNQFGDPLAPVTDLPSALQHAQTRARKATFKLQRYEAYVHHGVRQALSDLHNAREILHHGAPNNHESSDPQLSDDVSSATGPSVPPITENQAVQASALQRHARDMEVRFNAVAEFAAPLIMLSLEPQTPLENELHAHSHQHLQQLLPANTTPTSSTVATHGCVFRRDNLSLPLVAPARSRSESQTASLTHSVSSPCLPSLAPVHHQQQQEAQSQFMPSRVSSYSSAHRHPVTVRSLQRAIPLPVLDEDQKLEIVTHKRDHNTSHNAPHPSCSVTRSSAAGFEADSRAVVVASSGGAQADDGLSDVDIDAKIREITEDLTKFSDLLQRMVLATTSSHVSGITADTGASSSSPVMQTAHSPLSHAFPCCSSASSSSSSTCPAPSSCSAPVAHAALHDYFQKLRLSLYPNNDVGTGTGSGSQPSSSFHPASSLRPVSGSRSGTRVVPSSASSMAASDLVCSGVIVEEQDYCFDSVMLSSRSPSAYGALESSSAAAAAASAAAVSSSSSSCSASASVFAAVSSSSSASSSSVLPSSSVADSSAGCGSDFVYASALSEPQASLQSILSYSELLEGCLMLDLALSTAQEKIADLQSRYKHKCAELEQLRQTYVSTNVSQLKTLNLIALAKLQQAYQTIRILEAERVAATETKTEYKEVVTSKASKMLSEVNSFFSRDTMFYLLHLAFGSVLMLSSYWKKFISWFNRNPKGRASDLTSTVLFYD